MMAEITADGHSPAVAEEKLASPFATKNKPKEDEAAPEGEISTRQPTREVGRQEGEEQGGGGVVPPNEHEASEEAEPMPLPPSSKTKQAAAGSDGDDNDDDENSDDDYIGELSEVAFSDVFQGDLVEVAAAKVAHRLAASSYSTAENVAGTADGSGEDDDEEEDAHDSNDGADAWAEDVAAEGAAGGAAVVVGDGAQGVDESLGCADDLAEDKIAEGHDDGNDAVAAGPSSSSAATVTLNAYDHTEGAGADDVNAAALGDVDIGAKDDSPSHSGKEDAAEEIPMPVATPKRRERRKLRQGSPRREKNKSSPQKQQAAREDAEILLVTPPRLLEEVVSDALDAATMNNGTNTMNSAPGNARGRPSSQEEPWGGGVFRDGDAGFNSEETLCGRGSNAKEDNVVVVSIVGGDGDAAVAIPVAGSSSPTSEKRRERRRLRLRGAGGSERIQPPHKTGGSNPGDDKGVVDAATSTNHIGSLALEKHHGRRRPRNGGEQSRKSEKEGSAFTEPDKAAVSSDVQTPTVAVEGKPRVNTSEEEMADDVDEKESADNSPSTVGEEVIKGKPRENTSEEKMADGVDENESADISPPTVGEEAAAVGGLEAIAAAVAAAVFVVGSPNSESDASAAGSTTATSPAAARLTPLAGSNMGQTKAVLPDTRTEEATVASAESRPTVSKGEGIAHAVVGRPLYVGVIDSAKERDVISSLIAEEEATAAVDEGKPSMNAAEEDAVMERSSRNHPQTAGHKGNATGEVKAVASAADAKVNIVNFSLTTGGELMAAVADGRPDNAPKGSNLNSSLTARENASTTEKFEVIATATTVLGSPTSGKSRWRRRQRREGEQPPKLAKEDSGDTSPSGSATMATPSPARMAVCTASNAAEGAMALADDDGQITDAAKKVTVGDDVAKGSDINLPSTAGTKESASGEAEASAKTTSAASLGSPTRCGRRRLRKGGEPPQIPAKENVSNAGETVIGESVGSQTSISAKERHSEHPSTSKGDKGGDVISSSTGEEKAAAAVDKGKPSMNAAEEDAAAERSSRNPPPTAGHKGNTTGEVKSVASAADAKLNIINIPLTTGGEATAAAFDGRPDNAPKGSNLNSSLTAGENARTTEKFEVVATATTVLGSPTSGKSRWRRRQRREGEQPPKLAKEDSGDTSPSGSVTMPTLSPARMAVCTASNAAEEATALADDDGQGANAAEKVTVGDDVAKGSDINLPSTAGTKESASGEAEASAKTTSAASLGSPTRCGRRRLRKGGEPPQIPAKENVSNAGETVIGESVGDRTSMTAAPEEDLNTKSGDAKETPGIAIPAPSSPSLEKRRDRRRLLRRGEEKPKTSQKEDGGETFPAASATTSSLPAWTALLAASNIRQAMGDCETFENMTSAAPGDEDNSIKTRDNAEGNVGCAPPAGPFSEKRWKRRQLRKGGEPWKFSKETQIGLASSVESQAAATAVTSKVATPLAVSISREAAHEPMGGKVSMGNENSTKTGGNLGKPGIATSAPSPSSDKRRERRQIRKGGEQPLKSSKGVDSVSKMGEETKERSGGSETNAVAATADDDGNSNTHVAAFSQKRRERRKLRRGEPPDTRSPSRDIGADGKDGDGSAALPDAAEESPDGDPEETKDDHADPSEKRREGKKHPQPWGDAGRPEPCPPAPGSPPKSAAATRRLKIAERVARGIVPVPKALPSAKVSRQSGDDDATEQQQPSAFGDTEGSSSAAVIGKRREDDDDIASDFAVAGISTASAAALSSPESPSSQQERLIVTPTNEVEMKLVDEANAAGEEKAGVRENEARRRRRRLRRGAAATNKEHVEMALSDDRWDEWESESLSGGEEIEPWIDERGRIIDEARDEMNRKCGFVSDKIKSNLVDAPEEERRSLRTAGAAAIDAALEAAHPDDGPEDDGDSSASSAPSFVDPEAAEQIARALDRARGMASAMKEGAGVSGAAAPSKAVSELTGHELNNDDEVDDEGRGEGQDVKEWFLQPPIDVGEESLVMLNHQQQQHPATATTTPNFDDEDAAAWDANNGAVSGLNATIDQQCEARNAEGKSVNADDSRPLLPLEMISSDHHGRLVVRGRDSLEVALASVDKLLSQKERLIMYTSGEGFGVGDDSSVDNENGSVDDENESVDDENEIIGHLNCEDGASADDKNVGVEVGKKSRAALFDYKVMNNIIDDAETEINEDVEACDFQFIQPIQNDDVPIFPPADERASNESRARRWDRNPDAVSEVDDESEFNFDSKSATTDGSAVFGLRFVGSSTVCSSSTTHPPTPPPQSPVFEQLSSSNSDPNNEVTPKASSSSARKFIAAEEEEEGQQHRPPPPVVKLFKIPPPPPEKLRQWEESKGVGKEQLLSKSQMTDEGNGGSMEDKGETRPNSNNEHPPPPPATATDDSVTPRGPGSLNYKIHLPKSPPKKKHSLLDELDLPSHKRMAEKIALARAKAERKFEEEYNNSHHTSAYQQQRQHLEEEVLLIHPDSASATSSKRRFFCAGETVVAPLIISGSTVVAQSSSRSSDAASGFGPESNQPMPAIVGELVRGAFSPWKIPDRADDDTTSSSIASSAARLLSEHEAYANATAAAVNSIRGYHGPELGISSSEVSNKDDSLNESFEVSLDDRLENHSEIKKGGGGVETMHPPWQSGGGGALTEVLRWLFEEVLGPSTNNSSMAFSAFDIQTSTTVQADRVKNIANVDESLNIICDYVAKQVRMRCGGKADGIGGGDASSSEQEPTTMTEDNVPRSIISDDVSVSTYESSSFVTTSSVLSEKNKQCSTFAQKAAARIFKGKKDRPGKVVVEAFEIPLTSTVDGSSIAWQKRPSADVLAANFVGFLQQVSSLTEIPSPYGNGNPFLQSVVHNLAASTKSKLDKNFHPKRESSRTSMQDLVFPNEDMVVATFLFLWKACCSSRGSSLGVEEDVRRVLSAIEEDNAHDRKNKTDVVVDAAKTTPRVVLNQTSSRSRSTTVRKSNKQRKTTSFTANKKSKHNSKTINLNTIFPNQSPSPFETAVWNQPSIVVSILSFLGNPVAVCVMKRLNVFCNRVVCENQHVLMRDAVRLGGMSKYVRPSFWLWVTERWKAEEPIPLIPSRQGFEPHTGGRIKKNAPPSPKYNGRDFLKLKEIGSNGKWQHVIERDVTRAFGNMPPHKTGARYRQDSIVRALVSFGKEEIMRNSRSYQCAMDKLPEESEAKHFKLSSRLDRRKSNNDDSSNGGDSDSGNLTPTDTVSDWGGISPVGSMVSEDPSVGNNTTDPANDKQSMQMVSYENGEVMDSTNAKNLNSDKPTLKNLNTSHNTSRSDVSDPVLSGNALTSEMKVDLQNKLRSILHALAARHEAVGYCQGMDYVVAHLLRVLQDTILLRVVQRSMPAVAICEKPQSGDHIDSNLPNKNNLKSTEVTVVEDWRTISSDELRARMNKINSHSVVVEEVVFGVMDTFFSTYNLQHMYWPELRCLKTCCRVFESLIKQKLPVLADHFQHYDLNVGLFALGWFQTLFLYLPSMPSTTVCHIWDIWLVERSFKIFFRVGTAILFLSQPTLLNHDDDGMMTYLNTFPDATLMRRDILIPCALQIKITNRMLVEIEKEVAMSAVPQS